MKFNKETEQILKRCLYALNTIPNSKYIEVDKKTNTYKLASDIEKFLEKLKENDSVNNN